MKKSKELFLCLIGEIKKDLKTNLFFVSGVATDELKWAFSKRDTQLCVCVCVCVCVRPS